MAEEEFKNVSEELEAFVSSIIVMAMGMVMILCFLVLQFQDERQAQYERQQRIEEQLVGKDCKAASESKGTSTASSEQAAIQTAQLRSLTKAEVP